jgi:hypothetical protein
MVNTYAQFVLAPESLAFSRLMISGALMHPHLATKADEALVTRIHSQLERRIANLQRHGL